MRTTLALSLIVSEWLDNIDVVTITKASYRTKINLWFRWLAAHEVDPRTPARRNVIDYKQDMERGEMSSLTVNAYITVVKLFYKYCESVNYYKNIGLDIRSSVRYKGHRKSTLIPSEAVQLIDSVEVKTSIGKRDRLILTLMLYLGLRTCEVEHIDINDFDVISGTNVLRIQRKGRREKVEMLAVSDDIIELMEDYIADRNFNISDPLFVTHCNGGRSQRLPRTTMSKIIKSRLRGIGIDRRDITAHSLRHTCASIMVEQGIDIEKIRDILGHTTTATTWLYTSSARQHMLIRNSPSMAVENAIKTIRNNLII